MDARKMIQIRLQRVRLLISIHYYCSQQIIFQRKHLLVKKLVRRKSFLNGSFQMKLMKSSDMSKHLLNLANEILIEDSIEWEEDIEFFIYETTHNGSKYLLSRNAEDKAVENKIKEKR